MKIFRSLENIQLSKPVITIGMFDGVHRGHAQLLSKMKACSQKSDCDSVVISFDPHPQLFFKRISNFSLLTTHEEKAELLANQHISHYIIIPFDEKIARLTAEEFVGQYLVKKLNIKHLVVGFNHRLGCDQKGTIEDIQQLANKFRFTAEKVEPFTLGENKISSSQIRKTLEQGNIVQASLLLGYDYFIQGTIVEGNRLGRTIGFPTANIQPDDENKLIPRNGVYAIELAFEGKKFKGMMNIGFRPTVNEIIKRKTVEVHIFDFSENIYNQRIKVIFKARMRNEMKFESLELLRLQLENDKTYAKKLLSDTIID